MEIVIVVVVVVVEDIAIVDEEVVAMTPIVVDRTVEVIDVVGMMIMMTIGIVDGEFQ
jgi:hypothetical protein